MIETVIMDYLTQNLNIPVFTEFPQSPRSQKFVIVERIGGPRNNHIDRATITLQSYAQSMLSAAQLNERVKKAMDDIISLDTISKSKLNSDYNYTDTARKMHRYQAVYDLVYFD